ncbi:DUF805 domain-containing protein [Endozoicomonas sp. SM1973]|uniref:DUF805 domain-containing protein n=1 Tax=Spartinivicinus marinus TaxID=2994442 RepID=A0A853IIX6_9GAMM|nr:DUF805 domain-containing protein [Spartinivicinus marinus]MCX4026830.1 DUF805 domain-containing protein [Spartinivicinus marinus]NYZ69357.1 DUF805 domain-containing protein [Spartinivicinus marinus]
MSSQQNPYLSPKTNVISKTEEVSVIPKFFGYKGRINRLRYFVYNFLFSFATAFISLFAFIPISIIAALSGGSSGAAMAMGGFSIFLYIAVCLVSLVYFITISIRRCHDLNKTGWLTLLMAIPVVGFFLYLYLLFAKGTEGANRWGAEVIPSPTWHKVIAWLFAGLIIFCVIIGFIAGIANAIR